MYGDNRGRSQTFSPAVPYRAPDYYMPPHVPTNIGSSSIPRQFNQDQGHNDAYHGESSFYGTSRKSYDARNPLPLPSMYNQSYDRRQPSPSEFHLTTSSSYRHYDRQPMVASLQQMKRPDIPPMNMDDFAMAPHPGYGSQSESALTAHSDRSADSEFNWPPNNASASTPAHSESPAGSPALPAAPPADPPKAKKPRREKPRIELAPDQPPTTQGKPRSRVYVACVQCRTRKIRCDGAKPTCHNCGRRSTGSNECVYDPVPKRRGPDKCPGARQRMARNGSDGETSRRRRRTTRGASQTSETGHSGSEGRHEPPSALEPLALTHPHPPTGSEHTVNSSHNEFAPAQNYGRQYSPQCACHGLVHCPDLFELTDSRKPSAMAMATFGEVLDTFSSLVHPSHSGGAYITDLSDPDDQAENGQDIGSQPSLNFARKVWWDSLLCLYASSDGAIRGLTSAERETTSHRIGADLRWIFRASNYWFSFFHIPSFFGNFYDPQRRERMQPSLILGLLAISTFFQSSEVGAGRRGRERALRFREEAQAALDASFNSGWVDETLAQAAWLLALFEVCAHPRHKTERTKSSLMMLDSIIRSLSLTFVDADDPNTTLFPPGSVPVVSNALPAVQPQQHSTLWYPDQPLVTNLCEPMSFIQPPSPASGSGEPSSGCNCKSMTLGEHWPYASDHAPMWGSTPAWDDSWSEGDIRKESIRRLCWSSMIMAAGHISYTMAHRSQSLDLFIANPSNYALLFSGESITRSPASSSKQTIWALHDRAFLLWHGCIRMRNDNGAADMDKAQFAVKAWLEADALEQGLNKHTCAIERTSIFQAREYIFNTRMCISYEFQRYIPLVSDNINGMFHRKKAEEWLTHQAEIAQRFMLGLHTITGVATNLLARRPFFVFWFMGQISRSLSLWNCDNSLTVALDVCKALLPAIDYLTALWPCTEQRLRYEALRDRLEQACYVAGVQPPPPPNYTLPPPTTPEALV